jgi:hypothetical protein
VPELRSIAISRTSATPTPPEENKTSESYAGFQEKSVYIPTNFMSSAEERMGQQLKRLAAS